MATRLAHGIALLLPTALMAGALGSQYIGGLYPCEMCMWQRYPHYAAIAVALFAFVVRGRARTLLVALAGALIAVSGAIGAFHAGVEYHWWQGFTACTSPFQPDANPADMLNQILNAPLIRCDTAQWTLFGISLAGYNAIFSLGGAAVIFGLLARRKSA